VSHEETPKRRATMAARPYPAIASEHRLVFET